MFSRLPFSFFSLSGIVYKNMARSNITFCFMQSSIPVFILYLTGTTIIGVPSKKNLDEVLLNSIPHALGIIFNDTFSYKLEVFLMYGNPFLKEDLLGDFSYKILL